MIYTQMENYWVLDNIQLQILQCLGRAIFSSGAEIPLKNTFELEKSEINDEIYQKVLDDDISSFKAEGVHYCRKCLEYN